MTPTQNQENGKKTYVTLKSCYFWTKT